MDYAAAERANPASAGDAPTEALVLSVTARTDEQSREARQVPFTPEGLAGRSVQRTAVGPGQDGDETSNSASLLSETHIRITGRASASVV